MMMIIGFLWYRDSGQTNEQNKKVKTKQKRESQDIMAIDDSYRYDSDGGNIRPRCRFLSNIILYKKNIFFTSLSIIQ